MEKALQDCCRSMRIGKILVDSDSDTHEAHVVFAKFPDDIANRKVRQFSVEKIHFPIREREKNGNLKWHLQLGVAPPPP